MNYFDILLAKKLEDDRDPKVEGLSVTENGRYHEDGVVYDPVIVNVPETPLSKLTVTQNGTYTAPTGTGYNEVDVDVPLPSNAYLLKEIEDVEIASFDDGSDLPMPKLEVAIEPQQDLHGYDSPWVGGSGKNKLEFSLTNCKSITQNTGATWSGNVLSHANVNFSVEEDGVVKTNGTASFNAILRYAYITPSVSGDYIINGLPQNGGYDTFEIMLVNDTFASLVEHNLVASGTTVTLTAGTTYGLQIIIRTGYNSNGLTFKPMIRLASVSDATFAPYSNICPIIGWDECKVGVVGKNWFDKTQTFIKDKYIDINGNIQNTTYGWEISDYIPLKNNTNYCISGNDVVGASACNALYDKDKNLVRMFNYPTGNHNGTFSTNANEFYIRICTQESVVDNVQLEIGSTATTYEPYNGQTITIDLDGTRYGGKVDLVSGVMTVDRVNYTFDGTETWAFSGTDYFQCSMKNITSTNYGKTVGYNLTSNGIVFKLVNSIYLRAYVSDNPSLNAQSDMNQIMSNGTQSVYELATPLTIQLSPTQVNSLLQQNNVWADCGEILDLSYLAKEE